MLIRIGQIDLCRKSKTTHKSCSEHRYDLGAVVDKHRPKYENDASIRTNLRKLDGPQEMNTLIEYLAKHEHTKEID